MLIPNTLLLLICSLLFVMSLSSSVNSLMFSHWVSTVTSGGKGDRLSHASAEGSLAFADWVVLHGLVISINKCRHMEVKPEPQALDIKHKPYTTTHIIRNIPVGVACIGSCGCFHIHGNHNIIDHIHKQCIEDKRTLWDYPS